MLQPLANVSFADGFWAPRRALVRDVMLPYQWRALNDTIAGVPPSYAIHNLRVAAGLIDGTYGGPPWQDSDLAKWIEAVAYVLADHDLPELEADADSAIALLASAQQPDGYLNSYFITHPEEPRWSNLRDRHELYCAGHLLEAAVAYHAATGKRRFLDVMESYMGLIERTFGRGNDQKRGYPGHEEIELALVKLYRHTGERRWLDLATYFVDERGRQPCYFALEARQRGEPEDKANVNFDYTQAHLPVREQTTAEGHSVRACYLYAAMADVAAETGDAALLAACRKLWRNIVDRRMYVHGGVGSSRFGERFTFDYDLPNEEAYAETCAAIALVFFSQRLLNVQPDGEIADVVERALYNGILSGVSLDATRFFYDNVLASHPPAPHFNHQKPPERCGWFGCACCPPNLARLFASLGNYVAASDETTLWLHQYAAGSIEATLGGTPVTVGVDTRYPWEGRIALRLELSRAARFGLALRLPGWAEKPTLAINGQAVDPTAIAERGYARFKRDWRDGDTVVLDLPMPVRRLYADPRVRQNAGRVALKRGPIVYCLEEIDNGPHLNAIELPVESIFTATWEPELLGGIVSLTASAQRRVPDGPLYAAQPPATKATTLKAIPYYAWANRGPGEMLIWVRERS